MNLPNKLTVLRVILIPFFLLFVLLFQIPHHMVFALIMTALICFTFERWIDPVAVVLILAREFMVTGLRLVVASEGVVVAAGIWGKLKTAFTMVALIAIMVLQIVNPAEKGSPDFTWGTPIFLVNEILIWIAVVLTVISGAVYLKGYWKYIDSGK